MKPKILRTKINRPKGWNKWYTITEWDFVFNKNALSQDKKNKNIIIINAKHFDEVII